MNRDQHREIAERLLSNLDTSTTDLLRAIGHAVLAGATPALAYDAFNPPVTTSGDTPNVPTGTRKKVEENDLPAFRRPSR